MSLGRYRLVVELARGGMGMVWLAESRGPGGFAKTCVVKELLPELASDPHHRAMFLDEASLAARLSHKNIVQTNEVGCEDGRLFMALELVEGCSLRRVQALLGDLRESRGISRSSTGSARLSPTLAARILCEVLAALEYAHSLPARDGTPLAIVHRDVTPQNVILGFDGQVKLLDFGVAKSRARREKTRLGFAKGCVAYMSPDHVSTTPIDRRADVFSAGIVLRELLTGERLWKDAEEDAIVHRLAIGEVPELDPSARAQIPTGLRRVCEIAMAKNRDDRFETAAQMRAVLVAWLDVNDPHGSLAEELTSLFADRLAGECTRVRKLHQVPAMPKPVAPIDLPSADLMTDANVDVRARRLPKRETFVTVMALIAMVAAGVSIVGSRDDDDRPNVATTANDSVTTTSAASQ